MKSISSYINPIFYKEYFGFTEGHSYLNDYHIKSIESELVKYTFSDKAELFEIKMASMIGSGYGISFAAARMAFYSLMKILKIGKNDEVILLGSTCSVMPNAVLRTGATPVFSDVDPDTMGSSADHIEKIITIKTKMIVAQHSFGIPCEIDKIVKLGRKYNLFVLEDSAIAFDSTLDGKKVGSWGDASLFSTDSTKPIDTIIGGFIYTENKSLYNNIRKFHDNLEHLTFDHHKRLYNNILFYRKYSSPDKYGIGRILMIIRSKLSFIKKKFSSLDADYNNSPSQQDKSYPYPAKFPGFLAQLGLFELNKWSNERKKRKDLLNKYIKLARNLNLIKYLPQAYLNERIEIIPLRFVYAHPNSQKVSQRMSKFIDPETFWFKKPIIVCQKPYVFGYVNGSCPISEKIGSNIINWPCVFSDSDNEQLLKRFQRIHS